MTIAGEALPAPIGQGLLPAPGVEIRRQGPADRQRLKDEDEPVEQGILLVQIAEKVETRRGAQDGKRALHRRPEEPAEEDGGRQDEQDPGDLPEQGLGRRLRRCPREKSAPPKASPRPEAFRSFGADRARKGRPWRIPGPCPAGRRTTARPPTNRIRNRTASANARLGQIALEPTHVAGELFPGGAADGTAGPGGSPDRLLREREEAPFDGLAAKQGLPAHRGHGAAHPGNRDRAG